MTLPSGAVASRGITQLIVTMDSGWLQASSPTEIVVGRLADIDSSGKVHANDLDAISGDSTAADNLEAACDGTGYNLGGGAIRDDILDRVLSGNHDISGSTGRLIRDAWTQATLGNGKFGDISDLSDWFRYFFTDIQDVGLDDDVTESGTHSVQTVYNIESDIRTEMDSNSTQLAAIVADTDELQTNQGNWVTATSVTVSDKTGFSLASDGLDSISITAPSGVASNFREMMVQVWRRFFKKTTATSSAITTFADDGSTTVTSQTVSDDGTTQTQGSAS